jgi:hypothetical protein
VGRGGRGEDKAKSFAVQRSSKHADNSLAVCNSGKGKAHVGKLHLRYQLLSHVLGATEHRPKGSISFH